MALGLATVSALTPNMSNFAEIYKASLLLLTPFFEVLIMPAPFAAAASMPLLAGGGGLALVAAAAGGAGGTGGLFGVGSALSGLGALGSAFMGGGGGQADYSSLYAQLVPGQVKTTLAGQELAAMMGTYTGILGARSNVAQESALGQFDVARQKDLTSAGLQTGIASQLASSAIGLGEAAGKAKLATEMLGPETAASLAKQFGTTAGALQQVGLQGETQLLLPTATAAAQTGLEAAKTRNQQVLATTQTNLNIAKAQEDTRNALALQRGQVEGQLAMKRFGAGMAMAGQRAFA
jgi:hypothetical protein